jgi:hypothetical protein
MLIFLLGVFKYSLMFIGALTLLIFGIAISINKDCYNIFTKKR